MDIQECIHRRVTTNGHFKPDPIRLDHQHRLVRAASRAPSHFNSQPWRFILITDAEVRSGVADVAGRAMERLMSEGEFFTRYRRYFRFSAAEMDDRRDGIFIDKIPAPLRPFTRQVFTEQGQKVLNTLRVPKTLGADNRKLVAGSPLHLAAMLTRDEYREGELSGMYSMLGLGMAIENIWLSTVDMGMGMQFISAPGEFPDMWAELETLLEVPEHMQLMAMFRLGYLPDEKRRPTIDWASRHRKRLSQYVYRNRCSTPESDSPGDREPSSSPPEPSTEVEGR